MRICLVLEGSYPYVHGGVSTWMHSYIQAMPEHEFVLWVIGAKLRIAAGSSMICRAMLQRCMRCFSTMRCAYTVSSVPCILPRRSMRPCANWCALGT